MAGYMAGLGALPVKELSKPKQKDINKLLHSFAASEELKAKKAAKKKYDLKESLKPKAITVQCCAKKPNGEQCNNTYLFLAPHLRNWIENGSKQDPEAKKFRHCQSKTTLGNLFRTKCEG